MTPTPTPSGSSPTYRPIDPRYVVAMDTLDIIVILAVMGAVFFGSIAVGSFLISATKWLDDDDISPETITRLISDNPHFPI